MTTTFIDIGDVVGQNDEKVEIRVTRKQHSETLNKGSILVDIGWSDLFVGNKNGTERLNGYLELNISSDDIEPHIMDDGSVLIEKLPEELYTKVYDKIVKPVRKTGELTEPHQKHGDPIRWNYYNLNHKTSIEVPISVVEDTKQFEENSLLTFKQSLPVLLFEQGYSRGQIASRLDISKNTVDDRLAVGREKIHKSIWTAEKIDKMNLDSI